MENHEYYMSILINPHTENNDISQEDIAERGAIQFKLDSITDTIGTKDCSINIDLFYDDVVREIDDDMIRNFYQETLSRLVEYYDLDVLDQERNDRFPQFNIIPELKQILIFFEQNKWIEYMVNYLPIEDVNIIFSNGLKDYLNLHYSVFINNLKQKKSMPYLVGKYLFMTGKYDLIETLLKLISKHKTELASEYVLKLEGRN